MIWRYRNASHLILPVLRRLLRSKWHYIYKLLVFEELCSGSKGSFADSFLSPVNCKHWCWSRKLINSCRLYFHVPTRRQLAEKKRPDSCRYQNISLWVSLCYVMLCSFCIDSFDINELTNCIIKTYNCPMNLAKDKTWNSLFGNNCRCRWSKEPSMKSAEAKNI